MELRHVRYFIAAAEEEHFGRAAARMEVTRPAVSRIVADLEAELDTRLFERGAQRVRLTLAGRALLPRLKAVLTDLESALHSTQNVSADKEGVLTLGYGPLTLLHPLFRATVKRLHEACPELTLLLREVSTSAQLHALTHGKIDAGFMHLGPSAARRREPALERLRIQVGGLGAVLPCGHPLAGRRDVSLAELRGEDFVLVPKSSVSPGYGALMALCLAAGFEPRVAQLAASTPTQLNLVAVGLGIGLTVAGPAFDFPAAVSVVPLNDVRYPTTFALGWLKGASTPALGRLRAVVREMAAVPR